MDDFVIFTSPGKREVADAVVPMGEFEVEDAGKAVLSEAEVPRGEVAMDDDAGPAWELKARDPFAGALQVPPEDTDIFRVSLLTPGEDSIQHRVGKNLLAAPPPRPLPHLRELCQTGMELGQEAAPRALLFIIAVRVNKGGQVAGEEEGEAPDMPRQFHRSGDGWRDGPSQGGETCHQAHLVVD